MKLEQILQLKVGCPNFDSVRDSAIYPSFYSVPKIQSCLGVIVENFGPKKTMRVENVEENVG